MDRSIRRAVGLGAGRVVHHVRVPVPTPNRQIDATNKGQAAVDAHDLLVVSRIDRMPGVELQSNAGLILPLGPKEEGKWVPRRMHDGDAPDEDVDLELGPRFNKRTKQLAQRRRYLRREVWAKSDTPVEIPANNY